MKRFEVIPALVLSAASLATGCSNDHQPVPTPEKTVLPLCTAITGNIWIPARTRNNIDPESFGPAIQRAIGILGTKSAANGTTGSVECNETLAKKDLDGTGVRVTVSGVPAGYQYTCAAVAEIVSAVVKSNGVIESPTYPTYTSDVGVICPPIEVTDQPNVGETI